jgi:hypothetical protein
MTLAELMEELETIVVDDSLSQFYKRWINEAILEIASDFHLPALRLIEPVSLPVTVADWLYDAPDNFHKNVFRAADSAGCPIGICRTIDGLHSLYHDVAHSRTEDHVTHLAVQDRKIGIFPRAEESIYLWFCEKPAPLDKPDDEVTCIPAPFQPRTIIPKLVIKNFRLLQDLVVNPPHQSILFWQEEYKTGLHGSARGEIGLINYLAMEKGPRRYGGRDPLP